MLFRVTRKYMIFPTFGEKLHVNFLKTQFLQELKEHSQSIFFYQTFFCRLVFSGGYNFLRRRRNSIVKVLQKKVYQKFYFSAQKIIKLSLVQNFKIQSLRYLSIVLRPPKTLAVVVDLNKVFTFKVANSFVTSATIRLQIQVPSRTMLSLFTKVKIIKQRKLFLHISSG
jgi:hypothetical protein